jgi:F0F1-type ATP synthase assembly protein I
LPLAAVELVGLILLGVALGLRWRGPVPSAVILLAAPEALLLAERGPALLAPLLGAGLLLVAELSFWSLDFSAPARSAARLRVRLAVRLASMAAGTILGWLVMEIGGFSAGGTIDLTILGAAAVLAILVVAAIMVRSAVRPASPSR